MLGTLYGSLSLVILWCGSEAYRAPSVTMNALSGDIGAMYTTVRTNVINNAYQVTSLHPAGYLSKLSRKAVKKEENRIREIVYIPSLLSRAGADFSLYAEDDEHWCSQLCEKGYVVHVLTNLAPRTDYEDAIESILSWRAKSIPVRSICVCASELACPILLRYLSIALMMGPHRKDVGAVALVQPPPLLKLSSVAGKNTVLSRYKGVVEEEVKKCVGVYGQAVYDLLHNKTPVKQRGVEQGEDASEKERKRLEEARLRAEIETLEWQSSDEYKGKEAKRMRNLKKKKAKLEKMVYNKSGAVQEDDLLAAKLRGLARNPLTVADICQEGPGLRRASMVGGALKDRILVVCTDDAHLDAPSLLGPLTTAAEGESEELEWPSIDEDSTESIFNLMDAFSAQEDVWGRKACEELAALYQNDPIVYLPDIVLEEEGEVGGNGQVLFAADGEEGGERDVWDIETTRRHRVLGEVIDQWLQGLALFSYI